MIVAFIVTPWAAYRLLGRNGQTGAHSESHGSDEDWTTRLYRNVMEPFAAQPGMAMVVPARCRRPADGCLRHGGRRVGQGQNAAFRQQERISGCPVNMPDNATLEDTAAAAFEMGDYLATVNEVVDYQIHVGTSGPVQFQRPGAPLLPAPFAEPGRHPGQPGRQRPAASSRATPSPNGCGRR